MASHDVITFWHYVMNITTLYLGINVMTPLRRGSLRGRRRRRRGVKLIFELSNKNSTPSGGFQSHDLTVMRVYRKM